MASLTTKNLFIGYSTLASPKGQNLVDIDLVKQDLLNQFNTKKNERVMRPTWGCGIWDYLFEPLESVRDLIVYEAEQVIASDSRVLLKSVDINENDYGIRINMTLYYVPLNALGSFSVDFDRRTQQAF